MFLFLELVFVIVLAVVRGLFSEEKHQKHY